MQSNKLCINHDDYLYNNLFVQDNANKIQDLHYILKFLNFEF